MWEIARRWKVLIVVLPLIAQIAPISAQAITVASAPGLTRYSVVRGCYTIRETSGKIVGRQVGPFRMQATGLGQYLLFGLRGQFLADRDGNMMADTSPSPAAEWRLDGDSSGGFAITNIASGRSLTVSLNPAHGCAVYPEAHVGATGLPFSGVTPQGTVRGLVDAHSHVNAFEIFGGDWHCGRPWHPYGIAYALPDCATLNRGTNGFTRSFMDNGTPFPKSDTRGWPKFADWPAPHALAEEGDYYTGIQRVWQAGLRILTVDFLDNEQLCSLQTQRHNPCNDMDSVRLQARRLRELQDYIDAQSGGPGQGWFRIVTNPAEARQVVASGKLAVVQGAEVSRVLGCRRFLNVDMCPHSRIDAGLREFKKIGIVSFFPVHKSNNAFGGTAMDEDTTGLITNAGNVMATGTFWNVRTCDGPARHDKTQTQILPQLANIASMLNMPLSKLIGGAVIPIYPPAPNCNTRGLSSSGEYLIDRMMDQGFIIETDHMSADMAQQVLATVDRRQYPGVISSHSWDSGDTDLQTIYRNGGMVTLLPVSAADAVRRLQTDKSLSDPNRLFGYGYGGDMNGLAPQPGPDNGALTYPFTSLDGTVTFEREQWGERTFDFNKDGLANYGMYADWIAAQQRLAAPGFVDDMLNGAEAYLRMWEGATMFAQSARR
jgi:microsomal dipeptidase-like Zn-dependent dipeptidase